MGDDDGNPAGGARVINRHNTKNTGGNMSSDLKSPMRLAETLMNAFADGTGIRERDTAATQRYLWTDAFAVQNFLALSTVLNDRNYLEDARRLIHHVHQTLGKFAPDDPREGWISELSVHKGSDHPTRRGLRIGKKELERKRTEPFDSRKEWVSDGQYYHYHTRWIQALLQAAEYLDDDELVKYAAELSLAGRFFIERSDAQLHMHWKMSVDLSYPLVPSMGAHDPLDGYLGALECKLLAPKTYDFTAYLQELKILCEGKNWQTTDPLGLGGLLLNTVRSVELDRHATLPDPVKPEKVFLDVVSGLDAYASQADLDSPAPFRLAFRECGLSLGLQTINGHRSKLDQKGLEVNLIDRFMPLADQIEDFWCQNENREHASYREHLQINDVTLAASLLARRAPRFYGMPRLE